MHQLAAHVGVLRDSQCEPEQARFAIPGSQIQRIIPAFVAKTEIFDPTRRYTLDAIDAWLKGA